MSGKALGKRSLVLLVVLRHCALLVLQSLDLDSLLLAQRRGF